MTWTDVFLVLSIIFNVLFIWYIIKMIKRVLAFQERLDEFVESLGEYEGHLDVVYNLESFYGDATLNNLLAHSKAVAQECQEFRALYYGEPALESLDEEELEMLDGA
jgi:hypothetical protein